MSKYTKGTMGVICSSILLQIVVNAKDLTHTLTQDQPVKTSITSSSSAATDQTGQLAMTSDTAENKVRTEVKSETKSEITITNIKAAPKNPPINLNITVHESKMNARPFTTPDSRILGVPRSFGATAYALRGLTKSGVYVRRGVIAADPRVLPLGSVVEIKAGKYSGVYTVQDTGKKIKGKIIDLWMPSTHEARQFGRRQIKLHVLRYGRHGQTSTR
jgi:3D (Asp-Asp-Asp) domain-containing protein